MTLASAYAAGLAETLRREQCDCIAARLKRELPSMIVLGCLKCGLFCCLLLIP